MNIKQFQYFSTVARFMNFGRAAKHLNMAQSALSYGIASLEDELQFNLFFREGRSIRLTPAGAYFLKEVDASMAKMKSTIEKCRNIEAELNGTLRIAFLSSIIKRYYSEWVPPFQEKYPSARVITGQLPMQALRESLINETIDIGITRLFDIKDIPELDHIRLYSDNCSLACHKDHILAKMDRIDYEVLADEPFIVLSPESSANWYHKVFEICQNRGFSPNVIQTPHSIEAIYNLLEFGMGVSIMPSNVNLFEMPNVKMIKLEPGLDTQIDVVAAWRKDNATPIIPVFIEELEHYTKPMQ